MSMYKIIQNNKVVDVVQQPHFLLFLSSGHIAFTNKASAQGIMGSDDKLYSFKPVTRENVTIAAIEEITLEEFNRLQGLLNSNQEQSAEEAALTAAKYRVIKQLSSICKAKINSGFSVKLSDGKTYDFKLTTEDQLNLLFIENQLHAGSTNFLYHATNQPCRFFSREDMTRIIAIFKHYVQYHTTYFNVAKQYVNSLTDLIKVNKFTYGTDVTEATDNKAIKQILKNGGNL